MIDPVTISYLGSVVLGGLLAWLLAKLFYKRRMDTYEHRMMNYDKQLGFAKEQHKAAAAEVAQIRATLRMLSGELRELKAGKRDTSEVDVLVRAANKQLDDLQSANTILQRTLNQLPS
jgi:chromosome segregation ATPase